jgi:hypothetical protein
MTIILKSIRVQWGRLLHIFAVLLLSLAVVTFVRADPGKGMPGDYPRRVDREERDYIIEASPVTTDNLLRDSSASAATPRIITAVIQSFASLKVSIDRTEAFPSGIGTPFTYHLSYLVGQGATVSNITVTPTGGGTCTVLSNLDISCSGVLTSLVITYQYSYTPTMHPPYVILDIGGSDTTSVDYTINVFYPSTFTFVESTPPPDSHTPATRALVWTRSNAFELRPAIRFQALDLYGTWLPLAQR